MGIIGTVGKPHSTQNTIVPIIPKKYSLNSLKHTLPTPPYKKNATLRRESQNINYSKKN